jgi:hypothetical protein
MGVGRPGSGANADPGAAKTPSGDEASALREAGDVEYKNSGDDRRELARPLIRPESQSRCFAEARMSLIFSRLAQNVESRWRPRNHRSTTMCRTNQDRPRSQPPTRAERRSIMGDVPPSVIAAEARARRRVSYGRNRPTA